MEKVYNPEWHAEAGAWAGLGVLVVLVIVAIVAIVAFAYWIVKYIPPLFFH